jgi:UDP-N-acetylmuramate dehydrogenase
MMFSAAFKERNQVSQVVLSEFTTMRVGGAATLVLFNARQDFEELFKQPVRWLGKGANLVVSDEGVPEPVVKLGPDFGQFSIGDSRAGKTTVRVGAAYDLAKLISACIQAGLAGPEGLAGVPATVGGALRMNAGTSTCWMFDWVSRVEVVLPGQIHAQWVERKNIAASYRNCGFPDKTIFLGCELELAAGDPETLRATAARLKKAKAATQPLALPSAGCVFKNPSPTLPAGKLIDELGLKGERCGNAIISPVHANFIVNDKGKASTADIIALIHRIRDHAWAARNVALELEVETWNCPPELHAHPRGISKAMQ